MNALLTVLHKTLVVSFYRRNAGLFFVVLLLAGSFLRAGDHIALAEAAVHSPVLLGLYQALWLAYTVFATRFAANTIRQTDVLHLFRLVPRPRRGLGLLMVQYGLLNPVLVYTAFVSWVSWQQGTSGSTAQLIAGVVFMLVAPLFWLDHALRTPTRQPVKVRFSGDWHERFTTPYPLFFIRHLVIKQPIMLFTTKGGTCLLTLGVLALYPTDDYDSRLLALGALVTALVHSTIAYQLYQFEHEQLALLRNLPILVLKRLFDYALMFALLLIPEAILLLRYQPDTVSFGTLAGIWAFGHSVILLQFTLLLIRHRMPDQLMSLIFGLLLVFFLGIMYQFPGWGLSLVNWTIAGVIFNRYYLQSIWVTQTPD